jgi:hypothetical protein|tara:strand:- start:157 stop:321 length:165 start_codon:yes stop_codon:yes gene_type:complete
MNDMTPTRSLADVSTCDLNQELIRRDGVEAIFLGPRDSITKEVRGPAWLIVNRD